MCWLCVPSEGWLWGAGSGLSLTVAPCLSLTCVLEKDEAAIERSQFNATSVADVDKRVKRRLLMGNTFLPLPLLSSLLCTCARVWCVLACGVCGVCVVLACWAVSVCRPVGYVYGGCPSVWCAHLRGVTCAMCECGGGSTPDMNSPFPFEVCALGQTHVSLCVFGAGTPEPTPVASACTECVG